MNTKEGVVLVSLRLWTLFEISRSQECCAPEVSERQDTCFWIQKPQANTKCMFRICFSSFIWNCFPLLFAIVFLFYLQLFSTFICNCIPLLIAIVFLFYLQLFSSFICNYFSLTKLQFWAKYLTWHDVSLGCPESEDGEDPSCPPPPHHSFLGKKKSAVKRMRSHL